MAFNNNIRCIEIGNYSRYEKETLTFNNNIRCIEI